MRVASIMIAAALALTTAPASAEEVSDWDRFQLWNACRPVDLIVEGLSDDAGKIGLRREDIETAVRARLRGARIYDENADPYLYVNVNVLSPAFSTAVRFKRNVEVLMPFWVKPEGMGQLIGYATVWDSEAVGLHGASGSGFILSGVARATDKFIDEYLRVNADAC